MSYIIYDNDDYAGLSKKQILEKEIEQEKAFENRKIEIYRKAKEYCEANQLTKISQYDDTACRSYAAGIGYNEVEVCYFADDVYGLIKSIEFNDVDY